MDLLSARAVKTWIRSRSQGRFAVGLSRGFTPSDHRVSILLQRKCDIAFARAIVEASGGDADIELFGVPRPTTSVERAIIASTPLKLGASVGHAAGGGGSLGFFAVRRSDGVCGFVSCNHVIARSNEGKDGDAVTSPAAVDGEPAVVARLDGRYPRLAERAPADCAFAALADGIAYDASSVEGGTLALERAHVEPGLEVTKVGRITDARPGLVSRIEVDDVRVRYGRYLHTSFDGVIVIESPSEQPFCSHGDSGALVYSARTFQPVGLLFATSFIGGPHNAGWTWVHPASRVEDALGVNLVNR